MEVYDQYPATNKQIERMGGEWDESLSDYNQAFFMWQFSIFWGKQLNCIIKLCGIPSKQVLVHVPFLSQKQSLSVQTTLIPSCPKVSRHV